METSLEQKQIWSMDDFCKYTGFKQSYAYKLTHERVVPFFKPTGGKIFFKSEEIIAWLTSNPVMSAEQVSMAAASYSFNRR